MANRFTEGHLRTWQLEKVHTKKQNRWFEDRTFIIRPRKRQASRSRTIAKAKLAAVLALICSAKMITRTNEDTVGKM